MFRTFGAPLRSGIREAGRLSGGLRKTLLHALRMKTTLALAVAVGGLTFGQTAQATPVKLDSAQFVAQTQGLTVTTEDFSFADGLKPNPYTFKNGTFTGHTPLIQGSGSACPNSFWCLADAGLPQALKTFSLLPAGTQFWAVDLSTENPTDNPFDITVTGGSGILEITGMAMNQLNFLGFFDPLGIVSVSFQNKGTRVGNSTRFTFYSFDNVKTAGGLAVEPAPVPEPGTLALFTLGLLGLGLARRRKGA